MREGEYGAQERTFETSGEPDALEGAGPPEGDAMLDVFSPGTRELVMEASGASVPGEVCSTAAAVCGKDISICTPDSGMHLPQSLWQPGRSSESSREI